MAINKVEYGNTTLIDLTDMTAVASDVASGKTFYGKDGVLTTGTAINGLEYEEGTFEPEEDIARPTINFAKTHSTTPFYVSMWDVTQEADSSLDTMWAFMYNDMYRLTGYGLKISDATTRYGIVQSIYRSGSGSSSGSVISGSFNLTANSDSSSASSTSHSRYYINEGWFKPYSSSARMWRTGRTYKWIAVWK